MALRPAVSADKRMKEVVEAMEAGRMEADGGETMKYESEVHHMTRSRVLSSVTLLCCFFGHKASPEGSLQTTQNNDEIYSKYSCNQK